MDFSALKKKFLKQELLQQPDPIAVEWAQQCRHTPDNWKLEQYIRQLVFLPCDIKEGGVNHDLIKDVINGPIFRDTYTALPYTFWKKDLGDHSFPIPLPADYTPSGHTRFPVEALPIKGNLYFIPGSHLKFLDKHRQNGLQFTRERVNIRLSYRALIYDPFRIDEKTLLPATDRRPLPRLQDCMETVQAWMYIGIQDYWDPMINGIFKSQPKTFQHKVPRLWIKKYYKFPDVESDLSNEYVE